ncbi:MAG: ester cyclase [Myxococcota bacterium]
MSREAAEAVVRRYFAEVIDGRGEDLSAVFTEDCVVHRRDLPEPIAGREQLERFLLVSRFTLAGTETVIDDLLADEDRVAVRVRHRVTVAGVLQTPFGRVDAAGRTVTWHAMAWFRVRDGRIAEEWVVRDEVAIFDQLGVLP